MTALQFLLIATLPALATLGIAVWALVSLYRRGEVHIAPGGVVLVLLLWAPTLVLLITGSENPAFKIYVSWFLVVAGYSAWRFMHARRMRS